MYHLKIDQAFKKFSKKQGLIPNPAQLELVKNLENLIEDTKPSLLSSLGNIFFMNLVKMMTVTHTMVMVVFMLIGL